MYFRLYFTKIKNGGKVDLKAKRTKAGMSQMALAKKSGVGRYNISLAENKMRDLTKEEAAQIRTALKGVKNGSTIRNKKK